MKFRNKFLLLLMLCAAGHSAALTLGRVRGAALVGQPLDVLVQIQLNADEAATALCLEADVFHADSRQDPNRVRVTVEPTAQSNTVNARVISSSYIDEPMVTVYLRAGCAQKSSRRYVLLADFPSEASLPVLAPSTIEPAANSMVGNANSAPANPVFNPANSTSGNSVSNSSRADVAPKPRRSAVVPKPRPASRPKPVNPPPAVAAKAPAAVQPEARPLVPPLVPNPAISNAAEKAASAPQAALAPASSAAGQSRLKLDPLVGVTEPAGRVESSVGAPAAEGARDGTQDAQRMQSLEDSVKALVALAAKNEASLQDMRVRVQAAEAAQADRVPVQWLYGLLALVLACLAAMVYLWSRLSGGQSPSSAKDDWWRGSRNAAPAVALDPPATPATALEVKERAVSAPAALQKAEVESRYSSLTGLEDDPASDLDVSLVEMTESNFDQLMKSGKSHSAIRPGPLSSQVEPMPATTKMQALAARPINSEQLFDVRQQADFFVSLGQTDQAVQILEKQINDHGETSPLIYLDLLQIFHSLNLKTDFRQFREDFNLLFNARVPEFAAFRNEGKSLEEYPHVLAHITALWSTRKALMVIEASIFRDSLDDKSTPFDLAAFRDLLLLHAIAQSFTIREEPTSDLSPLRANMAPISKGARLSALVASPANVEAEAGVDLPLPELTGLTEVDIPLSGSGAGLLPLASLPSVTAVLNAPTALVPMSSGATGTSSINASSGLGGLDLDLDLDFSGSAALTSTPKSAENEVSDFSKLLKAQAPAAVGSQGFKAKAAAEEAGNSSKDSQADYLADNLLDFDLSSENAKLTLAKPKGNKSKPN